eukprot:TRINITY_DN11538_c0_g1_i2.p1 TRINITY_DN11538_c0_g1~~TRINITY_DN11538_c0_g1_i2.p1  ORF type:complete len:138 (+),score=22.27 TRINITY_DN11538_c0_g1_i2:172-585(+)
MDATQENGLKAMVGNYKGVMLCARPNEDGRPMVPKPFVSRVEAGEALGINPVPKVHPAPEKRANNTMLKRHKQWLSRFQEKIRQKQEEEEEIRVIQAEKRRLIKETAEIERAKIQGCLLYTSPSPRDRQKSRMPSSA